MSQMLRLKFLTLSAVVGLTLAAFQSNAHAQNIDQGEIKAKSQQNVVRIMAGSATGTYSRFCQDVADALDEAGKLRVMCVLGLGSVQNVSDIIFAKKVDAGIVQSDVLSALKNVGLAGVDRIQYVSKLYNEEVHLLVRQETGATSITDLAGKTVNIGREGSGTAMTAGIILDSLGIDVRRVQLGNSDTQEALRTGTIDATFYVAGQPVNFFKNLPEAIKADTRFISIPFNNDLSEKGYLRAQLQPGAENEYQFLLPAGGPVDTIAVGAVLAVYGFGSDSPRYAGNKAFVNALFNSIDVLKSGPYHPQWTNVDIRESLSGWTRFRAARDWLSN